MRRNDSNSLNELSLSRLSSYPEYSASEKATGVLHPFALYSPFAASTNLSFGEKKEILCAINLSSVFILFFVWLPPLLAFVAAIFAGNLCPRTKSFIRSFDHLGVLA